MLRGRRCSTASYPTGRGEKSVSKRKEKRSELTEAANKLFKQGGGGSVGSLVGEERSAEVPLCTTHGAVQGT